MSPSRVRFPIDISDFRNVRQDGFYYVDKTALIDDVIDDVIDESAQVLLVPRPRRFAQDAEPLDAPVLLREERRGQPGASANATLVAPPTKPATGLAPSPCRGASMSDLFFQDGRAQAPMQLSTPGMRHPASLAGERPGPRASLDACAATGE